MQENFDIKDSEFILDKITIASKDIVPDGSVCIKCKGGESINNMVQSVLGDYGEIEKAINQKARTRGKRFLMKIDEVVHLDLS